MTLQKLPTPETLQTKLAGLSPATTRAKSIRLNAWAIEMLLARHLHLQEIVDWRTHG